MSQRPDSHFPDCDVVIVGGGLSGLLASRMLADTGRSVVLVAPERRPDHRTTALLGASVNAIKDVGVWPTIVSVAEPLAAIRIIDATSRLVRAPEVLFSAAEIGLDAFGFNIPNEPLLAALETSVRDAGVRPIEASATGLRVDGNRAIVTTDAGHQIAARLVVAADGRNSRLREWAGIGVNVRDSSQAALVCEFDHDRAHQNVSTEFHTEHGPFTMVPLPGNRSGLVWVTTSLEAERLKSLPADRLGELIEDNAHALLGRMTITAPVQSFPLNSMIADRSAADRVVLIGEAAHAIPPIGAQGFNLTIRDIECLAKLTRGGSDPGASSVTQAYQAQRRGDVMMRRGAVDLINASLLSAALPIQLIRGAGLFALAKMPPIRRAVMRAGLGISTAN